MVKSIIWLCINGSWTKKRKRKRVEPKIGTQVENKMLEYIYIYRERERERKVNQCYKNIDFKKKKLCKKKKKVIFFFV